MAGALVLASNLVLVGLVVAFLGGRLEVTSPRPQSRSPIAFSFLRRIRSAGPAVQAEREQRLPIRLQELRVFLAIALLGTAALHDTVTPYLLPGWPAARTMFGLLCAAEIVVALLVVARPRRAVLVSAVAVCAVPLLVWVLSRTTGLPFGPETGPTQQVGLVDGAAAVLEVAALAAAVVLLRAAVWLCRPSAAQHHGRLALVGVVAVTVVGLGTGISTSGPATPEPGTVHPHAATLG